MIKLSILVLLGSALSAVAQSPGTFVGGAGGTDETHEKLGNKLLVNGSLVPPTP